jgi:ribulose kinase
MHGATFDALTRRTATAVSRRSSLVALGGAALGTAAAPWHASAGKAGKKAKKKCRKQVNKCKNAVRDYCNTLMSFEECLDELLPCCDPLRKCQAGSSTECIIDFFRIK